MNLRILLYFLSVILVFSCSKKVDEMFENTENTEEPEFNIELVSFDQNNVNFSYTINSNIENIKLIWNNVSMLDLDNKIGELDVDLSTNELTVPNLESGEIYYFRFVGEFNSEIIYSEIIDVTLLEQFTVTEYIQILNSVTHNYPLNEILKLNDGYLFFTGSAEESVSKTDNNFNVLWSIDINGSNQDVFYRGVFKLNDSNNYLMFLTGISAINTDPFGNIYDPHIKVHYVKFTINGEIIWHRENYTSIVDNWYVNHNDSATSFSKHSINNQLLIRSDSTYYTDNDTYYRALNFDDIGEISSSVIIDEDLNLINQKVLFQENNKFISYGTRDLTPNDGVNTRDIVIQKFSNNQLIQDNSYGSSGGYEYLSNILAEGQNILVLGINGHENESDGESRWFFNIDSNGEIVWEIMETEDNYSYRSKDLIKDTDGNYLSLFFDMYNVHFVGGSCCVTIHDYNFATLIKSDNEGNVIWKFVDGEENNSDYFEPQRVFQEENEYLIIGHKEVFNPGLWLKRILVE